MKISNSNGETIPTLLGLASSLSRFVDVIFKNRLKISVIFKRRNSNNIGYHIANSFYIFFF